MLIKIIAKADFPSSIKTNNNNANNYSLNPYYILRKLITLSSLKIHSNPNYERKFTYRPLDPHFF